MKNEEIQQAVLTLNNKVLNLETIEKLRDASPTAEEIETQKNYDGDETALDESDKFVRTVFTIITILICTSDDDHSKIKRQTGMLDIWTKVWSQFGRSETRMPKFLLYK